jgi:eukaryotic-like serine/threonine-protein kinase
VSLPKDPLCTRPFKPLDVTLHDLMAQAGDLSAEDLAAAALADLRERWSRGERVPAETYLERMPALRSSADGVLDLVYGEILVREELGEGPAVAEFVRRFPQHESALRRQFELHQAVKSQLGAPFGEGEIPPGQEATRDLPGRAPALGSGTSSGTRFHILRLHARGGLGEVFVAEDVELHREVALKEIQEQHADNPASRARFLLEAEVTGRLEHPGIVPVYGLGHYADGRPYYAMRFIKGDSLKEAIARFHGTPAAGDAGARAVAFRKLLARFVDVCNAIAYAHSRGVLHRDLKPGNIMLGKYGETLVVDWGLAKTLGPSESNLDGKSLPLQPHSASGTAETVAGSAIGTPPFMSPEQAAGRVDQLGPASDVYSLGATLYALLTGRSPFADSSDVCLVLRRVQRGDFPSPRQVCRQVPAALEAICLKAMALKPEDRYPTARALADDLEHWLADEPVAAFREPWALRVGRWARRHRSRVTAAAAALVVAVVGLTAATLLLSAANERERAATRQAEAHEKDAKDQKEKALHQLALSYIDQGVADWDAGRHPLAVFELYQAYRAAPPGTRLRSGALRLLGDRCRRLEILLAHNQTVNAVAYGPDGKVVLTGSSTAQLWDAATGKPLTAPLVHDGFVKAVAFAPDGKTVLTGSVDKTARLWNAATGQALAVLRHEGSVDVVAFSPDGKTVLTGCDDDTARLWDAASGKPLADPLRHQPGRGVHAVAFSPTGKTVVTGGGDSTARLWDAATGKSVANPLRHKGRVEAVAFGPDGKTILTGGRDKEARLWDINGKLLATLPHEGPVVTVAFGPDGKTVLTGSHDNTARLWDAETGKPLILPLRHDDAVLRVAYHPHDPVVLTSSRDGTVRLWDGATGLPLGEPLRHERQVHALAFSPDGKKVLTGSLDFKARLWDLAVNNPVATSLPHQGPVRGVFSPDSKTVFTGCSDKTARLWDAVTGQPLFAVRHEGPVYMVAYSPDGKTLLSYSWDGTARLWSAADGQPLGAPLQHGGIVLAAEFSPDGKSILTGSEDKTARLWDAATGKPLTPPLPHEHYVKAVAFSPDGKTAATCSADMTARLWDVASGKPLTAPLTHETSARPGPVVSARESVVLHAVAFSPDGKRLLTACAGLTARLWDVATGKPLEPALRHEGPVTVAVFSPDGQSVLTGSVDHTARLWDTATGKLLTAPLRHSNEVFAVAFSPDGQTVLTGSWDRTAQLWDAATGKPLGPALRHNDRLSKGAAAFAPDGKSVLTGSIDKTARIWHVDETSLADDPELVAALIAARTKLQMTPDGLIQPLVVNDGEALRPETKTRSR